MNQTQHLLVTVGLLTLGIAVPRPAIAAPPPEGWTAADIGSPEPPGSTEVEGSGAEAVWTVTGTGSDIWGSADQFQYVYTELPGDGGITARLLSQSGGHSSGWARTGAMLRESTEPGARFAMLVYTNGNGLQPAWRVETEEIPVDEDVGVPDRDLEAGPIWLRTQRRGQLYQHLISDDGKTWQLVGQRTVPIAADQPILAGLCATMRGGEVPIVATFDNVSVSADVVTPAPAGPTLLQAFPGSGVVLLTYATVPVAVGYNIYRQGPDDEEAAKLNAEPTANGWFIDDQGLTNGVSYRYSVRAVFQDEEGNATESLASDVVLAEPQTPIPPGFLSYDIGTLTPGATQLADDILTITGSGSDIWNVTDSFRFVAVPVLGDYSMSAKLLEKPARGEGNTQALAKAGLMIRENLDPGARHAMVFATAGAGLQFQWRRVYLQNDSDSLNNVVALLDAETTYPLFLMITRTGDQIAGYQSTDGTEYTPVGEPVLFTNLSRTTYAGFAVTAHAEGRTATAMFDATSVKFE